MKNTDKKEKILRENRKLSAFSNLALVWVGSTSVPQSSYRGSEPQVLFFTSHKYSYQMCDEIRAEAEMHFFGEKRIQTLSFVVSTEVLSWI